MFFFAYGSNMNHRQMLHDRCPGARFIAPAKLEGYWLVFDGYSAPWRGAVANILPSSEDLVWGGLFELDDNHLKALDGFEGYPRYYSRIKVDVLPNDHKQMVQAWAYVRDPHPEGTPSHEYLAALIQGARDCQLPEHYIWSAFEINLKLPPSSTRNF